MSGRGEVDATRWLWRFCSPYCPNPDFPEDRKDWAKLIEVADRGLILPRVAMATRAADHVLPADVTTCFDAIIELHVWRNEMLRTQLREVFLAFNAAGIEPIVLKGAELLLASPPSLCARSMLDLDIWVPRPDQQAVAIRILHELGYALREPMSDYLTHQHYPPFFRDGTLARIELHRHVLHPKLLGSIDEQAMEAASAAHSDDGARYRTLDARSALTLAYMQCRGPIEEGQRTANMMKWLDFQDRLAALENRSGGDAELRHLPLNDDIIAARFFTALQEFCGFPYTGAVDRTLVNDLEWRYLSNPMKLTAWRLMHIIRPLIADVLSGYWKGKSVPRLIRSLRIRLSAFRSL